MEITLLRSSPSKLSFTPDPETLAWRANLRVSKLLSEEALLNDESLKDLAPLRQFLSPNLAAVTKKVTAKFQFSGELQLDNLHTDSGTVKVATVTPLVVNDEIGENENPIIALMVEFDIEWLHDTPEASIKDLFTGIEMGLDVTVKTPESAPELRMVG